MDFPGTLKQQVISEDMPRTRCQGVLGSDPVSVSLFLHLQDGDRNASTCLWLAVSPPQPQFLHLSNKGRASSGLRSLFRQ